MSSTPLHYQNENLSVNLSREPGCRVRLEITVSPVAALAAYKKAIKNVSKEVSIPGFRKGKAPDELIKKSFEKPLNTEWKEVVLNTAFSEALELCKVTPYTNKSVFDAGVKSISLENGANVYVVYEAFPEIPSVDPQKLVLKPVHPRKISDNDVNRAIENLLLQHSEWNEVEDRPVAEGDFVDIDVEKIDEPTYMLCSNTRFEVAQGKMGDWMRKLLIGLSPGESAEGMSEKDDTFSGEGEFVSTQCRITVLSIKTAKTPSLDDEFAAKLKLKDVNELKEKITQSLNNEVKQEYQDALRNQVQFHLNQEYPFDIPQSLINQQLKEQQGHIVQAARAQKAEGVEEEIKKIEDQLTERFTSAIRFHFLIQKIAEENKIQVSQEELMHEFIHQMMLEPSGQSIISKSMDPQEVRSRLNNQVLTIKTLDFLIEKAPKAENEPSLK